MRIAMVADMHITVTDWTRALLDIKSDPCEDGPCWPTIRHDGSTLVLKLVDGSRRVPTITYSKHLGKIYSSLWTDHCFLMMARGSSHLSSSSRGDAYRKTQRTPAFPV